MARKIVARKRRTGSAAFLFVEIDGTVVKRLDRTDVVGRDRGFVKNVGL